MTERQTWRWQEGQVDRRREHLALSHADLDLPVAIVAPAVDGVFPVEFVDATDVGDRAFARAGEAARRELDFYLVELGEPDPWAYAIYHCGTASKVYSSVHWSWHPGSASATGQPVSGAA